MYLVYVSATGEPVKMPPKIEGVVAKYPDLFEERTGVVEREVVHAIEIIPGSSIRKGRIYRMSPGELDELRRQLKELVEKGWIRPSVSPYGSPVLFVPKKEGTLRMCIDYRGLNAIIAKNREPLPRIDDLLDRVQGCRYFSKIDLKSGYHQIAIRPEDQHKTAFQTRYGLYEFVVMPFGLCNAPDTFQHAMNRIFHDYLDKFVIVYLDDILIFSKTVEEHVAHLDEVLSLLRQHKFKINGEKCEFGRTRVLYLGYEISAKGLKPNDAKWMRTQPVLSAALKHWIEVIEQYDFEPQYIKGEYKVADELSRRPDFSGALITEFGLADDVTHSMVEAYREDWFMYEIIRRLEAKDKATSVEFELVNGLLFLEEAGNKRLCVQDRESLRSLFLGQLANESIAEYRQRFQAQLALIEAEEQCQAAAEAAHLQAEAEAATEKQRLQAAADADAQVRRKEAQDLLQRHEAASVERLKFWHFEPSKGHDAATPEEQHKEFLSKLVTRLVYTCNHLQFELANLRRAVRNHKDLHEDATWALHSHVQDLEQATRGSDADEPSNAASTRYTVAAPATINEQLDTLKTEVRQLHQPPDSDGSTSASRPYKMPAFRIEKFDDYTHQDPVVLWQGFTTEIGIHKVSNHLYISTLFLNAKGRCQIWLNHMATIHDVQASDLHKKISLDNTMKEWKKQFIVDEAPTLAINRLFATTQGNTPTHGWLTEWQKIQEFEYLGHFVEPQGIRPLEDKIEAIRVWPEPTNTTEVRSFMGLAGHYQRFITGYSRIAAPLTRLQLPKVPFVFSDEAHWSFQALKTAMLMTPVLSIDDLTLPTRVTTDASGYGIGAVLEQHDGDDWHPMEYFSHKVPPINSLDDARKKELLAFVMALKRWWYLLLGRRRFTWVTDNNPLTYYKMQDTVSITIGRWMYFIDQYDFKPKHLAGLSSRAADALSRRPDLCAMTHHAFVLDEEFQRHFIWGYESDPDYATLYAQLSSDHPPASHYRIVDGYLLLHSRGKDLFCVPRHRRLRTRLLDEYHDSRLSGYFGVNRTIARLRQRFWWPDLITDVTRYCDTCKVC
ncbi:hypothetical protein CBR_g44405 [Chara braunii]|uniref:Reverse transcriptase domain-containing protein n=1 Tax=Chara braunii TaxID=69332 RepID=A0A388LXJ9_CHABU|nr:hypothetical protein CBR_g44405 [Chara braunii]|eukprot:GBG86952.1 hypothetical protein CBR_g44405 [Chara braunii]